MGWANNNFSGGISTMEFENHSLKLVGQHTDTNTSEDGAFSTRRERGRMRERKRERNRQREEHASSVIAASLTVPANVGPRVGTYNANLLPSCRDHFGNSTSPSSPLLTSHQPTGFIESTITGVPHTGQ